MTKSLYQQNSNSIKKKKRTKKDHATGQEIPCHICKSKYFLSQPALSTHKKIKHSQNNPKPVNNKIILENEKEKYEKAKEKNKEFFNKEKRKQEYLETNEDKKDEIEKYIQNNYGEIYSLKGNPFLKTPDWKSPEEYPLYKEVHENWEEKDLKTTKSFFHNIKSNYVSKGQRRNLKKIESPTIDKLFLSYIKQVSKLTNKFYLNIIIKFIILFRQHINVYKEEQVTEDIVEDGKKEFTQLFFAKEITLLCNDFFSIFLQGCELYFSDEIQEEFKEIIQHFCFWLRDNHYAETFLYLNEKKEDI